MRIGIEKMILRLIGVGPLVALGVVFGGTGLMAGEYDFAPIEALQMAEEFDSQQSFEGPDQSHWNTSQSAPLAEGMATSSCCANCGSGACCPPDWYWEQNLRVLSRSRVRRTMLTLVEIDIPTNPVDPLNPFETGTFPMMTTKTPSFDIAGGYDMTVGHYLGRDAENRDQFVEFSFWGMNVWNEKRRLDGRREIGYDAGGNPIYVAGELFSLFPEEVTGFNRAETHFASYSSDINNFELNARIRPRGRSDRLVLKPSGKWQRECQRGKTLSYLFGFRYLSLDEIFGWYGQGYMQSYLGSGPITGAYDVNTHNDLFGPQIGVDLMFHECRYSWGVQSKLAPLVNFSDQTSRVVTTGANIDPLANTAGDMNDIRYAKKDDCSLVGEVSILGNYRVRHNLVVHAGYHFVWITGLALAPEQIQFMPGAAPRLNDNGHVFYQGISGGLEWIW